MKVTVVKYNPGWVKDFEQESLKIHNQLGDIITKIHHIGSTAVPDLIAKPIIDMILEVKSLNKLDDLTHKLVNLDYEAMGEFGIPGRRYFRKGGHNRTHHIHAFKNGDPHVLRHLAFRDYLIEHNSIADEYASLKLNIAQKSNTSIEQYCDGKDAFVKHHESLALQWYKDRNSDD